MSTVDETHIPKYTFGKLREKILTDDAVKHISVKQIQNDLQAAVERGDLNPDYTPSYRNGIIVDYISLIPFKEPTNQINGSNRPKLKIRQSGISGHHCTGKGCTLCKKS